MKKIAAIVLSMVMILSFSACGSAEPSPYEGKYVSVAGEMMGIVLTGDDISGFTIELKSGGKGKMSVEGTEGNIKWSESEGTITIEVEGETLTATAEDDKLVFDDFMGMGMKLTFGKEGTDAANPENYS